MAKIRLDLLLIQNRLTESRALAQRLIMAGQVRVNDQVILKPSTLVDDNGLLKVMPGLKFVSRGGEKLEAALEAFPLQITGWVCADVGASTGGFTDCLLQRGARKVYTIDVGKGILHWKLRSDGRVVVMEGVNARYVERLPETVNLATVDASFISLKILLPVIQGWFENEGIAENPSGQLIALIKPQFEAGRAETAHGDGVIRNPDVHQRILTEVLVFAQNIGFCVRGLIRSPLLGPKGNVEFLAWMDIGEPGTGSLATFIESALQSGETKNTQ